MNHAELNHYGLVAAQPNTWTLSPCTDTGVLVSFVKNTVLAWVVSDRMAMPVTLDGVDEDGPPILMPDGRVEDSALGCWPSVDEFTAEMISEDRRLRSLREAKAAAGSRA